MAVTWLLAASGLAAACTATRQNADYSEVGNGVTTTLSTGSGHTAAINALGDLVAITAWCYPSCTPGTMQMGSQVATRTTVSGDHTFDGGSLFTGQGFIYYILSSTQTGNQTITWNSSGGSTQSQISYIDFTPSVGCTFSHHVDSPLGSSTGGGTTVNAPTINGVLGDLLFNFAYTTQHLNDSVTSPWSCPVYSGAGETGKCVFNTTINGQAYILSAATASVTSNWGIINTSTAWESLITSFTMTQNAANACPIAANYLGTPGNTAVTLASLGITTCWYVADAGSDANSGADKAHPWQHSPGMSTFTGGHTPAPGDAFIFSGGDTWHAGNNALTPYMGITGNCAINGNASGPFCLSTPGKEFLGTSTHPIYIGVDQTWFSGGSWSRPILTGDNPLTPNPGTPTDFVASCTFQLGNTNSLVLSDNSAFVIFDNFDLRGICQSDSGQPFGQDLYYRNQSNNYWVERLYIHGWTHTNYASCGGVAACTNLQGFLAGTTGRYWQNIVDGSDSDPAAFQIYPPGSNAYDVAYNVFRFAGQSIVHDGHLLHDNIFEHWYGLVHPNLYEQVSSNSAPVGAYYNNLIRFACADANSCTPALPLVIFWPSPAVGSTDYVFNNIMYGNHNANGEYINVGQNANTGGVQGTLKIFNNTFENGDNGAILSCTPDGTQFPFVAVNNHYITDGGAYGNQSRCLTQGSFTTEQLMTHTQASNAGYTVNQTPFVLFPIAANSPTVVGPGTNEQPFCAALSTAAGSDSTLLDAANACPSDTSYACTYSAITHSVSCPARTSNPRPASTAWNQGGYQFQNASGLAPPTNLHVTPLVKP